MEPKETVIVRKIIEDLTDRGGLQQAWEAIDEEIQDEIKSTWCDIVRDVMFD